MEHSALNRPRVSVDTLDCNIPNVLPLQDEESLPVTSIAATFLRDFETAVTQQDWDLFASLYLEDSWWRDSLTLTFDKRTLRGPASIVTAWKALTKARSVSNFDASPDDVYGMQAMFVRTSPVTATLDVPFAFSTAAPNTRCVGLAKLIPICETWKIWILSTAADHLEQFPFQTLPRKNQQVVDPSQCGKPYAQGLPHISGTLDAVVIGGNGAGIANASMLQSIGANVVVLDLQTVPGGLWSTSRYDSFRLHHSKFMSQLPLISPSADYDEFMSGKQLTAYMTTIVEDLKLPFFGGLEVMSNRWDKSSKLWNIEVKDVKTGDRQTLQSKDLVMSNGFLIGSTNPRDPRISDRDRFSGDVTHVIEYHNPGPYVGKDVVVVGAGNSGHDVADNLARGGAKSVTILQNSPIVFLSFDLISPIVSGLYQGQISVEAADFIGGGFPTAVMRQMMTPAIHGAIQAMGDRNTLLEEKGYMLNKEPDLIKSAFEERGSKFYMDHPNILELIEKDKVKVARGKATKFVPEGLLIRNGSDEYVQPAEAVILATGYDTIDLPQKWAKSGFLDEETASKIENTNRFGVDAEGETPGYTTFSGHQHLYFSGVGFYFNRAIARYTAIQVMANVAGQFPDRYRR